MLSIETAAEKLDCSKETLRSFINSGELPVVAVTDRIQRIKISDFNAFLDSRMRKPEAPAAPEVPAELAAPVAPPPAPAEAASEIGHDDSVPSEPAAPTAPEAPAFERCTATHPKTGKRCVLAAGHEGKHKLEE